MVQAGCAAAMAVVVIIGAGILNAAPLPEGEDTSAVTDHGFDVSQVLSGIPFAVAGAWGLNTDWSVISHGQQQFDELTIIDFSVSKSRLHETA